VTVVVKKKIHTHTHIHTYIRRQHRNAYTMANDRWMRTLGQQQNRKQTNKHMHNNTETHTQYQTTAGVVVGEKKNTTHIHTQQQHSNAHIILNDHRRQSLRQKKNAHTRMCTHTQQQSRNADTL